MNASEMISLYSTLLYVSIGIAVLGLLTTIFCFFYFKIPETFALLTGRAQKKTVEKMRSGEIKMRRSEPLKKKVVPLSEKLTGDTKEKPEEEPVKKRTNVVQTPEKPETTVLKTEKQTARPARVPVRETTELREEVSSELGATTTLTPAMHYAQAVEQTRFDVMQSVVVIHTDELI